MASYFLALSLTVVGPYAEPSRWALLYRAGRRCTATPRYIEPLDIQQQLADLIHVPALKLKPNLSFTASRMMWYILYGRYIGLAHQFRAL